MASKIFMPVILAVELKCPEPATTKVFLHHESRKLRKHQSIKQRKRALIPHGCQITNNGGI